jgi:hypothetical protein
MSSTLARLALTGTILIASAAMLTACEIGTVARTG